MPGLKNVTRVETPHLGRRSWILLDAEGEHVHAFTHFCRKNSDYAFATQKRYAEVVSRFIDYLIEAGVFGEPVSKRRINDVIDAYPVLLRDGSHSLIKRLKRHIKDAPDDAWLIDVAQALGINSLAPNSFSNTLAAINRFLGLSESLALEAFERAKILGIEHAETYHSLIEALGGAKTLSHYEKRRLRQNSMLGSVIRFHGGGLTRPRRLRVDIDKPQSDVIKLDFPLEHAPALIGAANTWRDKSLWLLLGASGIRPSEALLLEWSDIDIENQRVYIRDPEGKRFGADMTRDEKLRFKGRAMSMTYLFQPLRQLFFEALHQYVRREFVPYRNHNKPNYVFQYVEGQRRGEPYINVSAAALNKNFKFAVKRAGIPSPVPSRCAEWTVYSLRHMYGVYMLNDFPVDPIREVFGLQLSEVQMLMGHRNIESTRHYAKHKRSRLIKKLEIADLMLLDNFDKEIELLPHQVMKRLRRADD